MTNEVEEAFRRAAEAEAERARRAANQRLYLARLATLVDLPVLASEEMWRRKRRYKPPER